MDVGCYRRCYHPRQHPRDHPSAYSCYHPGYHPRDHPSPPSPPPLFTPCNLTLAATLVNPTCVTALHCHFSWPFSISPPFPFRHYQLVSIPFPFRHNQRVSIPFPFHLCHSPHFTCSVFYRLCSSLLTIDSNRIVCILFLDCAVRMSTPARLSWKTN